VGVKEIELELELKVRALHDAIRAMALLGQDIEELRSKLHHQYLGELAKVRDWAKGAPWEG